MRQGSTFGIPGVTDHAHFLREVQHTSAIRSALITNWNRANIPGRTRADRLRLLHTVVVGGGYPPLTDQPAGSIVLQLSYPSVILLQRTHHTASMLEMHHN